MEHVKCKICFKSSTRDEFKRNGWRRCVERVKTANRLKMSSWEYCGAKYACRAAAKR